MDDASVELMLHERTAQEASVPNDPVSDDNLVLNALQDPLAFLELYNRWVNPIYRYFISFVQDKTCAEDLTSKLFIKIWQVLPSYRKKGNFTGWMFRIAHNMAMDFFRKEGRETRFLREMIAKSMPLQIQELEDPRLPLLKQTLGKLKAGEIELLRLRFGMQLSFSQIGQVVGKSEQAVKKQVYRLLERMRREMEVEDENPEN